MQRPGGRAGHDALVSRRLSAAGIRFMGILSRPGIPPLLRSAYRAARGGADPSGVSMFRTRETRPGPGALYTPGTTVPARTRVHPMSAVCRLATAGPCHPGSTTRPGMSRSRGISKGSLAFAHPGHSPRRWPPDGTGALRLSPGLHTRLSRTQPRMPGQGQAFRHWPGITPSPSATSSGAFTHYERHHVAMHFRSAPRTGVDTGFSTLIVPVQEHFLRSTRRSAQRPG
jgi:hypothetical protein